MFLGEGIRVVSIWQEDHAGVHTLFEDHSNGTDGGVQTVATDESWQWSNDGPIRFADNKDGETVEAFRTPQYNGTARLTKHSVRPTCSNNVPVTEHERFHPTITTAPNGKKLLDFGQNIAGYVAFRVKARVGQRMVWRFGEMLDADGNLTQKNIDDILTYHIVRKAEWTERRGYCGTPDFLGSVWMKEQLATEPFMERM